MAARVTLYIITDVLARKTSVGVAGRAIRYAREEAKPKEGVYIRESSKEQQTSTREREREPAVDADEMSAGDASEQHSFACSGGVYAGV